MSRQVSEGRGTPFAFFSRRKRKEVKSVANHGERFAGSFRLSHAGMGSISSEGGFGLGECVESFIQVIIAVLP